MKIIGLGHRKYVGKDTAAGQLLPILCEQWQLKGHGNPTVKRVGFADKLKSVCRQMYPRLAAQEFYDRHPEHKGRILPEYEKSARDIWIEVGNKMREMDPLIWIRSAFEFPDIVPDVIIVTDVRYPNEVDYIRKNGGLLVKVERDSAPVSDDVADCALAQFQWFDTVLPNHGTYEELRKACQTLVRNNVAYLTTC